MSVHDPCNSTGPEAAAGIQTGFDSLTTLGPMMESNWAGRFADASKLRWFLSLAVSAALRVYTPPSLACIMYSCASCFHARAPTRPGCIHPLPHPPPHCHQLHPGMMTAGNPGRVRPNLPIYALFTPPPPPKRLEGSVFRASDCAGAEAQIWRVMFGSSTADV